MKSHTSLILGALVFGALVACSSAATTPAPGGDPTGGGNTTTDKNGTDPSGTSKSSSGSGSSTTPQSLPAAECARQFKCEPFTMAIVYDSIDACETEIAGELTLLQTAPGTGATAAALAACASATSAADCGVDPDTLPACTFKGTVANGANCYLDVQCASGNCENGMDALQSTTGCGTCADAASAGASCEFDTCAAGLSCNYATTTCAVPPKTGETGCDDLYCGDLTDRCINNTCVAALAKGAACTPPATDTDMDPCDGGTLSCVNGVCTDITATGKPGDACSDIAACAGGHCASGTCVAHVEEGGTCDPSADFVQCANEMYCDGDTKKCTTSVITAPTCPAGG